MIYDRPYPVAVCLMSDRLLFFFLPQPLLSQGLWVREIHGNSSSGMSLEKGTKRWCCLKIPMDPDNCLFCCICILLGVTGRKAFQAAVTEFEKNTCIRFVKHTNEKDYIWVHRGKG